ncbi:MAG: hemerythrin domain-containing protein [Rhizobiales bacterium]|nr:hemerythrin domain-containing protein [Hyphomicrobiales bacterium]
MNYSNRISQMLHDEHRATIALIERLEQLLARHRRTSVPDVTDGSTGRLLGELITAVEAEIERHFDFEENSLFSYLEAMGDDAIGAHLTDEHAALRPLGRRLATLARAARNVGFNEKSWDEFHRLGQEFCERMLAHVQKEEMALLPVLDESMDAEAEARLYEAYVVSA